MPVIVLDSLSVLTQCQKQNLASAGVTTVEDVLSRELPVKGIKLLDVKHKVRQACNIPLALCAHTWYGLRCHTLVTKTRPQAAAATSAARGGGIAADPDQLVLAPAQGGTLSHQRLVRGTIGAILVYPKMIRIQFKFSNGGEVERSGIYLLSLNRLWATSELLSDDDEEDGSTNKKEHEAQDQDTGGTELPRLLFTDESECKDFSSDDLSRLREYQWECNSLFEISRKLAAD